jgi:transposase
VWQAYEAGTEHNAPNTRIVQDRVHFAKYLNETVDKVRRAEHREIHHEGDDQLQGVRQILPFNPENLIEQKNAAMAALRKSTLATAGRTWSLKKSLLFSRQETEAVGGRAFFASWYAWVIRSRLDPIKKVARRLKTRLDRILTWFASPISNEVAGGLNSRIQLIKSAALGFWPFEHYRIRILFYCGKRSLKPQ